MIRPLWAGAEELAAAHSTPPPRLPSRKTLFCEGLKGGIAGEGEWGLLRRARHAARRLAALPSSSRLPAPPPAPDPPLVSVLLRCGGRARYPTSRLQLGKRSGVGFQLPGGGLQARPSGPSSGDATRRSLDPGRLGSPSGGNARVGGTGGGQALQLGDHLTRCRDLGFGARSPLGYEEINSLITTISR